MTSNTEPARGRSDRSGRPTIAHIAGQAGVSVPTVSKVINGRADVAPETRRRVEAAIRRARLHRSDRSPAGAADRARLPRAGERVGARARHGASSRSPASTTWRSCISEMQGRRSPGRGWIEGVLARRPTGVIAVFSDLSESHARAAPDARHPVGHGRSDRRTAARHPVDRGDELERRPDGHAAPARPGPPAHRRDQRTVGRSCAAAPASTATGRPWTPRAWPSSPSSSATATSMSRTGVEHGRALLRIADPPTAIFAGNDLQALGVYQAAREPRLHIPEDLSVVGFDDLPVARVGRPAADDRPPAARRDGRRPPRAWSCASPRASADPDPRRTRDRAGRPGEHGATERARRPAARLTPDGLGRWLARAPEREVGHHGTTATSRS